MIPPNGAQMQIKPDELRPVPCQRCKALRRKPITWIEHQVHYLDRSIQVTLTRTTWLCVGCGVQLTMAGKVPEWDDPLKLTPDEIEFLGGPRAEK